MPMANSRLGADAHELAPEFRTPQMRAPDRQDIGDGVPFSCIALYVVNK